MNKFLPSWALCVLAFLAGAAFGLWINAPQKPIAETAAAAIELHSGGIALARDPQAEVPKTTVQAVKDLGRGAKLERAAKVFVKPPPPVAGECKPVEVDLGLVKMQDGSRRVVATSPTGGVLGGVDVPINLPEAREYKWGTGATYDPINRRYGAFADRYIGRLIIGVEVSQQPNVSAAGAVRIGFRFRG